MKFEIAIVALLLSFQIVSSSLPCNKKIFKTGIVCMCNSTYCDNLDFSLPEKKGEVQIISTSRNGLRFKSTISEFKKNSNSASNNVMIINRARTFQRIVGFGNALTGAVVHNLDLLPQELQNSIYQNYFSTKTGIGMNMLRIPIGGCDFDLAPWAYNEFPENDKKLSNFTKLDKRDLAKIEKIKMIKKVTGNNDIKLLGAAWSSPKWMKTNNDWTGFGSLKEDYYQTWANYHGQYLHLMEQAGLPYWGISTGNEPLNGVIGFTFVKFMSLGWLPSSQGKWVANNLGPMMRKYFPKVKLLVGDDQRYVFPTWINNMHSSYPQNEKYIDGIAVHWYADKYSSPTRLSQTSKLYPDKLIITSEACSGDKPWEVHLPLLGYWKRAEDYATDIIENLNHFSNAWIDWNMVLDERGGPNYVNNTLDAAIIIDSTIRDKFYKQPIFYMLGHFSRFLPPNSIRVASYSSNRMITMTAFLRPDKLTAVVFYNAANYEIKTTLVDGERGSLKLAVPPKSIHTLLYR